MTFAHATNEVAERQREARTLQSNDEAGTVSALNALTDATVLLAEEQRTANLIAAYDVGIRHENHEVLEALIADRLDFAVERSTGETDG